MNSSQALRSADVRRLAFGPLVIETDLPLGELASAQDDAPGHVLRVTLAEKLPPVLRELYDDGGGAGALSMGRTKRGYRIDFGPIASFHLASDGTQVEVLPGEAGALDVDTLNHFLLDQVLPRALSLLGPPALHASAVADEHGAALFVGPTGRGKSTLAATMALHGWVHLGDDTILIRPSAAGVEAVPLVAGARLWPADVARLLPPNTVNRPMAGYTSKSRVPRDACPELISTLRPSPILRVYLVRVADDVRTRIEPIAPDAGCVELVRNAFRVALDDPRALRRELELFCDPALLRTMRELHRPQDHERLHEVRDAIAADLAAAREAAT